MISLDPTSKDRVNVPVALSPAMADTLSDLARRAGMSRSAVMRAFLAAGIERALATGVLATSKMTVTLSPPADFDVRKERVVEYACRLVQRPDGQGRLADLMAAVDAYTEEPPTASECILASVKQKEGADG